MNREPNERIEKYRIRYGNLGEQSLLCTGTNCGAFIIRVGGAYLWAIASDGGDWEHVSVSVKDSKRTPTWDEMCFVKSLWWGPEEVVIQYHPAESEYVNNHPGCLHLWRPIGVELPTPPSIFVGIKEATDAPR